MVRVKGRRYGHLGVFLMWMMGSFEEIVEGVRIEGYLQKKHWAGMQVHFENASDGPVNNIFILVFFHMPMNCGFTGNIDSIKGVHKNY